MAELEFERLFRVLNENQVEFILIGGMNYFLHFRPVTTQDIDIWISPTLENIARCELAMNLIEAEWGRNDTDWGPTFEKPPGWLQSQNVYCLLTSCGMVDIFKRVLGLAPFKTCWDRAESICLKESIFYRSLSAKDMLACQLAIPEENRRNERVAHLRKILGE